MKIVHKIGNELFLIFFSFIIERQKTIGLLIRLLIRLPLQMAEQPG